MAQNLPIPSVPPGSSPDHSAPIISPQLLRPTPRRRSPLRLWLTGAIGLVLICAAMIFWHHRVDRELRALPGPERRALYQRTLQTLHTCEQSGSSLEDYCREQADFLRRFPECDDACRKLARRFLGQPGR